VIAAAALVAVVALSTWIGAQGRALVVLVSVLDTPVAQDVAGALTREPRVSDELVAGVPTAVFRPGGEERSRVVVFVNGVTRRGRFHSTVRRLAIGLARTGHVTLVPDLPGLGVGELTPWTVERLVAVVAAALRFPDVHGRVAFVGVSAGGSLALVAAADRRLCERVGVVAAIAPYVDLPEVVRLATTGFHRERGRLVRYRVDPFVSLVAARALAASLPPGRDRRMLLSLLRSVPDTSETPLAAFRQRRPPGLGPAGRALVALLRNRNPRRFDAAFATLPRSLRAAARRLSPILVAHRLCARVELITAPHDKYFPPAESRALVRVAPDATLTVSETLQHADLEPSLAELGDLARLDAFVVRTLRAARR
jgi:alpha-beta hydrolase superfamily lysophospholipase